MKKLLIFLLLSVSAFATTTVTGTIRTLGTTTVGSGTFVRFWLRGCGGNQPRVSGSGVIAPSQGGVYFFDLAANGSGVVSGTIYSTRDNAGTGNGDIECGGSNTAVWYGMQIFLAGKGGPEVAVVAKNGSTLDISNVTPITSNPVVIAPTGDGTYLRLDAGNSPITGNLSFSGGGAINGIVPQGYMTNARPPLAGWMFSRNESFNVLPINIVILGDSQTICDSGTLVLSCGAAGPSVDINRWAEQLRIQLQNQYGSGGTGLVPLIANVGNTHVNAQYWTLTGSTLTSNILGPTQTNSQASGSSLVQMTTAQVATFHPTQQYTTPPTFTSVNIYCGTNASSGSLAVSIDSVGVGNACATPTGSATAHVVTFGSLAATNHTVALTCTGTCYLYGAQGANSTGVSVHNLSTASAVAEYFGAAPATQLAFSDLIPGGTQLVILDLGTNDVNTLYGYSVTSYSNAIQAILTHEAALSGAPSVLIVQPPVSNVTGGVANWPTYTAALLGLAQTNSTGYVNIQSRWGTTFNAAYFCADQVHPCDFGSLDEFSMISQAIVDPTPTSPFTTQAQGFNAITNANNPGNPFFNASCAPTACDAGVSWAATGAPFYQLALWSTGNAGGISTVLGLLDQATSIFPWNTNPSDDVCFGTPISGGNIATCAGAGLHYSNSNKLTTLAFLDAGGTAAVLSGTGACATITTQAGGAWAGTGKCTGTTGASTVTVTPGLTAPNGWICSVYDQTTRANLLQQTSNSPTACVLTATSITQNDVFVFSAIAF